MKEKTILGGFIKPWWWWSQLSSVDGIVPLEAKPFKDVQQQEQRIALQLNFA